jgi:Tfp pilus assembly protein FimT
MDRNVRPHQRIRDVGGFSAIELMMTVGIMGILMAMAVFSIGQTIPGYKGDGAMRVLLAQVNTAREMAIAQRRVMRLSFTGGNFVQIIREEIPIGANPLTTTVVGSAYVEGGATFMLDPLVTTDTPDGFGNSAALAFGSATLVRFNSEGSLVDQSGNPLNGTVFVELPRQPRSLRAVTVLGSTGRVRAYRWDGRQWKLV